MKRILLMGTVLLAAACDTPPEAADAVAPLDVALPAVSAISQAIILDGTTGFEPAETPETRAESIELEAVDDAEAAVQADPNNAAPTIMGLSDENDFDAVAGRQSIESDAERLAANRELYKVVEPTDLLQRPGETGPNIVAYALATNNPIGEPLYQRFLIFMTSEKYIANCSAYAAPDLAQIAFLAQGGPDKDPLGVDPDGDGFACAWDPTIFRSIQSN
jgi:hypothetical protein